MSALATEPDRDAVIWTRLLRPDEGGMAPEAARYFLGLRFDPEDQRRMHELAERHQAGELAPHEAAELAGYRRVGLQLDLLRSKARLSISHERNGDAPHP